VKFREIQENPALQRVFRTCSLGNSGTLNKEKWGSEKLFKKSLGNSPMSC
jgi:hypothetical protein